MAKQFNSSDKRMLSASVSQEARRLLEQKATATGSTMSDVLDKLIRTAFKPKRGLAKRIDKDKAIIKADLANAKARAEAELARLDLEWEGSLQAKLVSMFDIDWVNSLETPTQHLSLWLFTRRVFAIRDKNNNWCTGLHLAKACQTWMSSPMLPDKYFAADLVAETEMLECSEEAWEYLIVTCYDGSIEKAFVEFCQQDCYTPTYDEAGDQTGNIVKGFKANLYEARQLFPEFIKLRDIRSECDSQLLKQTTCQ